MPEKGPTTKITAHSEHQSVRPTIKKGYPATVLTTVTKDIETTKFSSPDGEVTETKVSMTKTVTTRYAEGGGAMPSRSSSESGGGLSGEEGPRAPTVHSSSRDVPSAIPSLPSIRPAPAPTAVSLPEQPLSLASLVPSSRVKPDQAERPRIFTPPAQSSTPVTGRSRAEVFIARRP